MEQELAVTMTKELSEDQALSVCAEVLHDLYLKGKNVLMLTTDDDEVLKVNIVSLGKAQEQDDIEKEELEA